MDVSWPSATRGEAAAGQLSDAPGRRSLPGHSRRCGRIQDSNHLDAVQTSKVGQRGLNRFVQGACVAVEVHVLNAVDSRCGRVVATGHEQGVRAGIALKVDAVDDDRELMDSHVRFSSQLARLFQPCGQRPTNRRRRLAWSTALRGVDHTDTWQPCRLASPHRSTPQRCPDVGETVQPADSASSSAFSMSFLGCLALAILPPR